MVKNTIKTILHFVKLEITKFPYGNLRTRLDLLKKNEINVILDIGANIGQYAQTLRKIGYAGKIISFEPLDSAFRVLQNRSKNKKNWQVIHSAIGAEEGNVEINIAGNSVSSSILPMLSAHEKAAPESKFVGKQKSSITTVDAVMKEYTKPIDNVFLKIDSQGYEKQILNGAKLSLKYIKGIQLEMSLIHLYSDDQLFSTMFDLLKTKGFELFSVEPGFRDHTTGQILQVDGIFFRI